MAQPDSIPNFQAAVKPVSQLRDAADLQKKLDSLRRGRQLMEQQWKVNLAFYKGRQYTYFNRDTGRLESRPVEDGEKPRYLVRLVSNQIISGAHSLLSKFTKTKPIISAYPGSTSDQDFKAAQMSEALLEYWWRDFDLDNKLEEALLWSIISGQGYWKITWDGQAGKPMRFLLDPQGQPILDDNLKDLFRQNLQQYNIQPQEQVVYLGDIKVEVISPFDVFLDPTARTFDECKYVICQHHLDVDEIKSRWGVDVKPDSISAAQDVALPYGKTSEAEPTVKCINIGYFKPTPSLPNGRYVVWMQSPQKTLEDKPWPYPHTNLPLVKFPGLRVPGSVYDSSVVEHAIPLQKELNRTISQIVEFKNLTIKPRVWAPAGSVRTRITSEPGALYEYSPIGDHEPHVEQMSQLPPYVFNHLEGIRNGLREIFSITEVTEGTLPPNLEAGIAIDLLQEMATDRLAPTIKLIEVSLAHAGQQMLSLAQEYYVEPRLIKIKGAGGSVQVKRFTQADINGGITVHVETGSGMPRTRAGRQARILDFVDKGILPPQQAYKYLDMGDLAGVTKQWQVNEDQAAREQDMLVQGQPLNPPALADAQQAIMQGINPDTGQPLDPQQDDPMVILQNAALKPWATEDYDVHLRSHSTWINSLEFLNLPREVQQSALTHYNMTMDAMRSIPQMPEPVAPRTTLQLKGTIGPTGAADILNKAGVTEVTPEIMTEPPLETWVSDSVDKPDVEGQGNQPAPPPEIQEAPIVKQAQDMRHDETMHELDAQKAMAQVAKAQADAVAASHKAREAARPKPKASK